MNLKWGIPQCFSMHRAPPSNKWVHLKSQRISYFLDEIYFIYSHKQHILVILRPPHRINRIRVTLSDVSPRLDGRKTFLATSWTPDIPWALMQPPLLLLNNFPVQTVCWTSWQRSPQLRPGWTSPPSSRPGRGFARHWWRSWRCFPPRHTLTGPGNDNETSLCKEMALRAESGFSSSDDDHAHTQRRFLTCPFLLTPIIPEEASCGAVTKMVSALIRFM